MKVMQVMAGAAAGGAETAFEDLCLAFHETGIEQKIILRNNNALRVARLRDAGLDVETLPFGGVLDLYTKWKLGKIIAAYQPQIVQTWMSRASLKTPISFTSPKSYLKVSRLGGYYGMKYFRTTDYFVTITEDIKRHLVEKGVEDSRIRHINNFADVEIPDTSIRRDDLGTPDNAFVVLSLARYHPSKALDVLIKAAAGIENCHLWLAGQGEQEKELKDLAGQLQIENRVHFLGWRRDRAALLRSADVCAFPSRYEPFGTTFVQAWAQRTPLVCSTADGPSQYVRNGKDALVFEIDDVDGLRRSLQTLKDDPAFGKILAEEGFARYKAEFSKDKTVEAYLAYYRDILAREGIAS